jgi:hypothetical protein
MNIKEFGALKAGDHVENGMNNNCRGEVIETTDSGVRVVWGPRHDRETKFFYSVQSTAWMHWSKAEAELPAASHSAQWSS